MNELEVLVPGRAEKDHAFVNRRGEPLTRFGIHAMVERYAAKVAEKMPSVATKSLRILKPKSITVSLVGPPDAAFVAREART